MWRNSTHIQSRHPSSHASPLRAALAYLHPPLSAATSAAVVATAAATLLSPTTALAEFHYGFRFEPQLYSGPRGSEPRLQAISHSELTWQESLQQREALLAPRLFEVRLRFENELLGRRDSSFDLDRAWYRTRLGATGSSITWGRIHPFDVSAHLEGLRPWGYAAQAHAQNRGINLGRDVRGQAFPQPVLMGWVGAHFWSDTSRTRKFQFGLSASPLFIPSMGSEVKFSEEDDTTAGRFARRPPGYLQRGDAVFPLRIRVDQSRLLQDIVLQPQVMAQARWDLRDVAPGLLGHLALSRAPQPDPETKATGFLRIEQEGIDAVALVTPQFPQRVLASLTHQYTIPGVQLWGLTLFNTLQARDDHRWGYEFGAHSRHLSISFLDEPGAGKVDSSESDTVTASKEGRYARRLIQAEATAPIGNTELYSGIKQHIQKPSGTWIRSGVRVRLTPNVGIDGGVDLFGGADGSYFGEWRTNDRVFIGFRWDT